MNFKALKLAGCYEILLNPHHDARGYFMRTFDCDIFHLHGLTAEWVQENQSMSLRRATLRGLHFQRPPFAETKLVRALAGGVLDVFVDLRVDSPTFGRWESVELSLEKFNMLYIPRGFAHGFYSLTDYTIVCYHVDACYAPQAEGGIRWNDETLKIHWPGEQPIVSTKDQALASFLGFESPFTLSDSIGIKEEFHV